MDEQPVTTPEAVQPTVERTYISNPFKVFTESFRKLFNLNFGILVRLFGVGLLVFVVVFSLILLFTFTIGEAGAGMNALAFVFGLVFLIALIYLVFILQAAVYKYSIETARSRVVSFREVWQTGRKKWLGVLGVSLLSGLIILGGLLLLIVPGIIFMYWFILAPYVYVDQEVGVNEALKKSKALVQGKAAEIFGLIGANMVFTIPSYIPLLGIIYNFFFTPVSSMAFGYRYVSAQALGEKPKPPTHNANYIAIVLLPILFVILIATGSLFDKNENSSPTNGSYNIQYQD